MSGTLTGLRWVYRHNPWLGVQLQAILTIGVIVATIISFMRGWINSIAWLGAITMLTWVDARAGNLLTAIVNAKIAQDADVQDVIDKMDEHDGSA